MRNLLILVGLLGFAAVFYGSHWRAARQGEHQAGNSLHNPATMKEPTIIKERRTSKSSQRQISSIQNIQDNGVAPKMIPTVKSIKTPLDSKPTYAGSLNDRNKNEMGGAEVQKNQIFYDPDDLELLKQAAIKAQEQGSKVAYIGQVSELYAFDPNFFKMQKDSTGRKSLHPHSVESYQRINTSHGQLQIYVQREPYPIPPSRGLNYDILNHAIIRATDDGATTINIASPGVDRSSLETSIQYARSRGIVVLTVPPPRT